MNPVQDQVIVNLRQYIKSLLSLFPLWAMLIVPFTTIIVGVVALTTYLSHQNSHRVVDDIAGQLMNEINARIETRLETFITIPNTINQTNATLFTNNTLDLSDQTAVAHYFWEQVQLYESVTSIYFGNTAGGLALGGREGADGSLYVMLTDDFKKGLLHKYATDETGIMANELAAVPDFDARMRPWYVGAVEQGTASWTAPYVLSTGQDLAIAASQPVYDERGNLLGVVSVDIFISHISNFLRRMQIGQTGQAYIIDESGVLVATSTNALPFAANGDATWQRLIAADSDDPVIATSAHYIEKQFGGFSALQDQHRTIVEIDGKRHYLSVTPYHDTQGLDWLIVLSIPEEDFLSEFQAQNRVTLFLTTAAVLIAVLMGSITVLQVTRPVARLSAAAVGLAHGDWAQTIPIGGVQEIKDLGQSFKHMAAQLHTAFAHLEERVQERTKELATSEARYRGIIEDQTELICRFLPDNTLTFVNDAYCQFFNKTEAELLGTNFMPLLHPEDQAQLAQQIATLNQNNPTITVEHRILEPDGQVRWMQWVNRALYGASGEFVEFQAVGRDLTQRKRLEETLQKALERETELSELKSHFISTVSHEFRTPLAIILNSGEIMKHYSDRLDKTRQAELIDRIETQVRRMTNLLEDVLTINQAERGKLGFASEVLDLAAFCQTLVDEVLHTTKTPIHLDFSTSGDCGAVSADKKLLRLILTNLISNAVKYSPVDTSIKVALHCSQTNIVFQVEDTGIGIPQDAHANIFEPFYRAGNVQTIAGTGLGLAIVKQSVEQHQGRLTFESEIGKGTRFTVTLPNIHHQEALDD